MDVNFNKNHSCGSEANQSESDRNMKRQSKKTPSKSFMAPTISTKSKCLSPKKRILTEWSENSINNHHERSLNLGKKSLVNELGVSKQPLSGIPTLPSSVLNTKHDEKVGTDVDFVAPYDPFTNCLTPRPKFLRYNPNRLRNRVILDDSSGSSTSISLDSLGSVSSSAGESCMIKEKEEDEDEDEVVDEDEEEVTEERKWGLKWQVVKCLMVFFVLIVSSMYIASMNLNMSLSADYKYGNITSGVVPLIEIDPICVESDRIMGYNVSKASSLRYFIDQGQIMDNNVVVESVTLSLVGSNEGKLVDFEPKCQVEEILAQVFFEGIEEKDVDFGVKSNDGALDNENEVFVDVSEVENGEEDNVDFETELVGEEANGEIKLVDEDETEILEGEDNVEYEHNSKNVVWVLIFSLMTFLLKLYYKCKKASSNTTNAPKVEFRMREKKHEPMQIGKSYLDSLSIAGSREERLEITPPPPPRVIPKVKVLSEFSIDGEVRRSRHRCYTLSKKEEDRMVMHKGSESKGESESIRSYFSKERTSNENDKEETMDKATPTPIPLRRSSRLRNRGMTSP